MRPLVSLTALALSAFLSVPAFAQKMDNNDAAAMKQLAQANLNEIEAGKMAAAKANDPDSKSPDPQAAYNIQEHLNLAKRIAGAQAAAAGSTTRPITPSSPAAPITPSSPAAPITPSTPSSPSINPGINFSK